MSSSTSSVLRSCLYGDGLFETMAYRSGQLRYWSYHWMRLQLGLQRLLYPNVSEEQVIAVLQPQLDMLREDAVIRLVVTRSGVRGYRVLPEAEIEIQVQVSLFPMQRWHGRSIKARWCTTTWAQQPLLAGIKHLNRLEQVLARSEWTDANIEEGLVCDTAGHIISGTMSALLVRHGQSILAADISRTGIDSVARRVVLEALPALGYVVDIRQLTRDDILLADEVVVMNAVQGIAFISECADYTGTSNQLVEQVLAFFQ